MNGEVQLIVSSGSTGYIPYGTWDTNNIWSGQTSWNVNAVGVVGSVPPYSVFTVGTILNGPGIGGNVETCVVTSFNTMTGDITTDVGLDYSNLIPSPTSILLSIETFTNTTKQFFLDLYANESISQNWKFQDLNNFTSQGAFSREFRIPYTDNNQLALGALFDVNVNAGEQNYFHYKLPAEIRVDTLPIASGYLRVRKVYRQLNKINEIELAFYAETPDLVRNIGDKTLADIAALNDLTEQINYDNVTTGNANRIWTLCDRGQRWSEGGEINTRSVMNTSYPVYASDLTPAINWRWLFHKIIEEAGFEFVGSTLDNILVDYWMPWCNSVSLKTSATGNQFLYTAQNSTTFTNPDGQFNLFLADTVVFDNNGDYNNSTYIYTAPAAGQFTFGVLLHTYTTIANSIQVASSINGATPIVNAEMFVPLNNNDISTTFTLTLNAGDTVQIYLLEYSPTTTIYNGSYLSLVSTNLYFGVDMLYALNAPNTKQIDFITDVIKMHNCAIVPDRAIPNRVYIVPQNSYLGSGATLDWTGKLDISKDITLSSTVDLQKARFQFTYSAGEDYLSKQYKNVNRIYGDYEAIGYRINPNTQPSDFAIGDQKVQLVTQSTPCGPINGTNKIIPQFLNDSQQFIAPGMKCLYESGTVSIVLFDDGGAGSTVTSISTLNHYSTTYPSIYDYDLNWSPEVPPYNITGSPYNNLFNLYWRSYMNALYSQDARIMEAYFALDLSDIYSFKFSDKVWIQDSWWRILEISDYKIGMFESTKVTLLKFLDDQEDCTATPSNVSYSGHVQFIDADGNPTDPTQDCCRRYGYSWDETNGVCWANIAPNERPNIGISGRPTQPASIPSAVQNRSVINSVLSGNDITVAVGNRSMLAVGNTMELTKDVAGSNLLGKNTYTNLPGIHIGGGWKDGTSASSEKGWSQHGIVMLHRKESWLTSGTNFAYYIEGVAGEYIELPNDTVWSALLNVTVIDAGNNYYTGQFSLAMQKVGGVAAVSALTAINQINNTAYTFTVGVNVAINTAQHRLYLNVAGGGAFPANLITTASIQYQQSKIS